MVMAITIGALLLVVSLLVRRMLAMAAEIKKNDNRIWRLEIDLNYQHNRLNDMIPVLRSMVSGDDFPDVPLARFIERGELPEPGFTVNKATNPGPRP